MDKEQAIKLAQRYKAAVAERLPLKALYLYGSYSKGNHTEDSDIDIAVLVERMSDDYFEDTPLLWKLKRKISYRGHQQSSLCRHSQNGNTDIKAGITYRNKYLIIKTILSLNIGIVANNLLNIAFIIA